MRSYLMSLAVAALIAGCGNNSTQTTSSNTAVATGQPVGSAALNAERLIANNEPGSWLTTGRGYHEQRFSPVDQSNSTNVKTLGLAWYADIDTERGQESTPIIVDGVMYLTTSWSMVKAYRFPRSGKWYSS